MLFTSTNILEGHTINTYHGIVFGETIIGANFVKDFFASITDVLGGRSGSYESVLKEAREQAMEEMSRQAAALGANAVIGIDFDYETLGQTNGMIMVIATGTAISYS